MLANGCFDLIHVGHVRYLEESRKKGAVLVVALNSDSSIRKLKGKGRPILGERERIEILEAFSPVDYITVFEEENVEKVLLALKPDVHAKGSDYTRETVPEKETVRAYGGEIAITGGPKVRSTSEEIKEIAAKFSKAEKPRFRPRGSPGESRGDHPEGSFLIIRLSSLGDIIHTLPAFSAMRKNFAQADIAWVVEEKGKEILDLVPGITRVITVKAKKWKASSRKFWSEIFRVRREIRNKDQTALDFQGLIKSGLMAFLSGAEKRLGFHRKNLKEPLASLFYTERLKEIPEENHVIDKNLGLLTLLGIDEDQYEFPFRIPREISESVAAMLEEAGYRSSGTLVVFNVGAAWETKRWFPQRWAEVIERMRKEKEIFPFLLWGNDAEKLLAEEISRKTGAVLSPTLNLKEVVALVEKASLIVSGDTFALQAACALGRPVVGIFGPTNPSRNGPFSPKDKIAFHKMPCSYCYRRKCPTMECLKKITAEEVFSLCIQALEDYEPKV